jgi:hypothetical protein
MPVAVLVEKMTESRIEDTAATMKAKSVHHQYSDRVDLAFQTT